MRHLQIPRDRWSELRAAQMRAVHAELCTQKDKQLRTYISRYLRINTAEALDPQVYEQVYRNLDNA